MMSTSQKIALGDVSAHFQGSPSSRKGDMATGRVGW